ncbi:hypothetical protein C8Q74DRAFT_348762 [Fomes fomentarius]|nr:hypothetical protein C8Q74DRAFT_348762 [Fomes fomentarius]
MSGYDERLLASAPAATRAEKQEGYNIDLLEDGRKNNNIRSTTNTPPPVPVLSTDHSQAEAGGYTTAPVPTRNGYASVAPPTPWYKTRKWLIIFLVGGVVIIAAVVGGAVGGTVGKSKSSEPAQSTNPEAGGAERSGPGRQRVGVSRVPQRRTRPLVPHLWARQIPPRLQRELVVSQSGALGLALRCRLVPLRPQQQRLPTLLKMVVILLVVQPYELSPGGPVTGTCALQRSRLSFFFVHLCMLRYSTFIYRPIRSPPRHPAREVCVLSAFVEDPGVGRVVGL